MSFPVRLELKVYNLVISQSARFRANLQVAEAADSIMNRIANRMSSGFRPGGFLCFEGVGQVFIDFSEKNALLRSFGAAFVFTSELISVVSTCPAVSVPAGRVFVFVNTSRTFQKKAL